MSLYLIIVLVSIAQPPRALDLGEKALQEFQLDDAIRLLEQAIHQGPYNHRDHIRLHEQLGIAYAYAGRAEDANRSFTRMLTLDATAAIRYSLSPKVTLLFEEVRRAAARQPQTRIEVTWPRDRRVSDPLPIDVEVVADPGGFMNSARLFARLRGTAEYRSWSCPLNGRDSRARILVPPLGAELTRPEVVEIHLIAYDSKMNEILTWASPDLPREVPLRFEETVWYATWWFWSLVGGAAAAASAAVYAATRDSSSTIGVDVHVGR